MGKIMFNGIEYNSVTQLEKVKFYSGKIQNTTGEVIADENFVYTDFMPMPNGTVIFDVGENGSNLPYECLTMYYADKTYGPSNWYWNPTQRYRSVDVSSYYAQGARFMRISFKVEYFNDLYIKDSVNNIIYSTSLPRYINNN